MFNFIAKSLVLVHTVLSVAAMTWALWLFFEGKDYGFLEPRREVLERTAEGEVKTAVRHASEYDKSVVALNEARKTRDLVYVFVKPALDRVRDAEPYLANNQLHYAAALEQLAKSPDKIEVKRNKSGGLEIERPVLGKPIPEDDAVPNVAKSLAVYKTELDALYGEIKKLDDEIKMKASETKRFTRDLTGTDEANMYIHPGFYQLIDREFKAQLQLKIEIDDIKPHWSKAIEQARLYLYRRADLEATLEKLKGPAPKAPKKQ